MKKNGHPLKWIIWTLAVVFYFYEFFLRVSPSVMVPQLMEAFSVNATAIGALSGFYFYIYAPMQLPVGMLTDRYGARNLLAMAAIVTGLGSLLFGLATTYWMASAGRFLIGSGSSFGFVGMLYICSHWFPVSKRNIFMGYGNGIGMLGAIFGQTPLRIMIDKLGWRFSSFGMAAFGILLGGLIYFLMRNDPIENKPHPKKKSHILKDLGIICKNKYTWVNAFGAFFIYLATPGFASLWAIPFLHTTYGVSVKFAGLITSMFFIGWAVGGPIIGNISDKIRQKKPLLILLSFFGIIFMCGIIYISNLPLFLLFLLFFLVGVCSSAELLNFSYAIDISSPSVKGTAISFVNFIAIIGAAISQPLAGFLLDHFWTGGTSGSIRIYSAETYKIAMSIFPIAFLLSFVCMLMLKKLSPHRNEPEPIS